MPKLNISDEELELRKKESNSRKYKKYKEDKRYLKALVTDDEFAVYKSFADSKNMSIAELVKTAIREYLDKNGWTPFFFCIEKQPCVNKTALRESEVYD